MTQLHHMYANCKRITYYLNTCGVALCPPLSLSFSLSDYPSLTGRHWSWDPYIYVCVSVDITMLNSCLLWRERISSIAQDWHIWYYYQWVQPQLLTPFWMCWRSAHWFRISILCILVCELFLLYFFIYIFIEKSLQWIGGSSNSFVCNLVDNVSNQVKE